ncbi:MAG: DUF1996 domain-containing protein [Acidimicrobiales bacterium]
MPALADGDGRFVLPERIAIEYKAFGGPGFDRSLIRPIPAGLQLVADFSVAGADEPGTANGDATSLTLSVGFPSCVRVDAEGRPMLASADHRSHLAYSSGGTDRADGCPASHPYRIPQLTYAVS